MDKNNVLCEVRTSFLHERVFKQLKIKMFKHRRYVILHAYDLFHFGQTVNYHTNLLSTHCVEK